MMKFDSLGKYVSFELLLVGESLRKVLLIQGGVKVSLTFKGITSPEVYRISSKTQ